MGMADYYSGKCEKCDTTVTPIVKKIGIEPFVIGHELEYKCTSCGHEWQKKVWLNF